MPPTLSARDQTLIAALRGLAGGLQQAADGLGWRSVAGAGLIAAAEAAAEAAVDIERGDPYGDPGQKEDRS